MFVCHPLIIITPQAQHGTYYKSCRIMDNGARVALKAYQLSWLVVGSQLLWDISRFQGLINDSSHAVSAKWVCDRWDDWQKMVAAAGMRHQDHLWKGIGSQAKFWAGLGDWRRRLPGPSLTTPGLLLVLAHRSAFGRPKSSRPQHAQVLEWFLRCFLQDEAWGVRLCMDTDAEANFGQQAIGGDCVEADIDEAGCMNLKSMLDVLPATALRLQLQGSWTKAFPDITKVQLGLLLTHLLVSKTMWLLRQLVYELALVVELAFPGLCFSTNPLDAETDFENLMSRRRPERDLLDRLSEGQGVTGSQRSSNPHQFAKAYAALKVHRLKMRCSVSRLWQRQLQEMLWAGKAFFSRCTRLCVSADASRFSGLDRLLVAIAGKADSGEVKAMWTTPMALIPCQGGPWFRAGVPPAFISGRTVFPSVSKTGFGGKRKISQRFSRAVRKSSPGAFTCCFRI